MVIALWACVVSETPYTDTGQDTATELGEDSCGPDAVMVDLWLEGVTDPRDAQLSGSDRELVVEGTSGVHVLAEPSLDTTLDDAVAFIEAAVDPRVLGDMDGDGFDELLVSHRWLFSGPLTGETYVDLGPTTLEEVDGVVEVGDVDGDGLADLLTEHQLVLGPIAGGVHDVAELAVTSWEMPPTYDSAAFRAAGDLDGDGSAELIVRGRRGETSTVGAEEGFLHVLPSTSRGAVALSDVELGRVEGGGQEWYFDEVVAGEDLDGDGYGDLLVGVPLAWRDGGMAGAVYVFAGPVSTTAQLDEAVLTIWGEADAPYFGGDVAVRTVDDQLGLAVAQSGTSEAPGALHWFAEPKAGTHTACDAATTWTLDEEGARWWAVVASEAFGAEGLLARTSPDGLVPLSP